MIDLYYKFCFTIVPSYLGSILKVCRSVYMHHVSRSRSTCCREEIVRVFSYLNSSYFFLISEAAVKMFCTSESYSSRTFSLSTRNKNKIMIYRSQTATILLLVAHFWPDVALLRQTLLAHFRNLRSQRCDFQQQPLTRVRQAVLHLRTDVRMCGEHEWCGPTCNSVE